MRSCSQEFPAFEDEWWPHCKISTNDPARKYVQGRVTTVFIIASLELIIHGIKQPKPKTEQRLNRTKMMGVALPPQEMKRVCCHLVLGSSPDVTALCLGSQCLIGEHLMTMITVPTSSGKKFLSSPTRPDQLWGPPSLLFSGEKSGQGVKLTKRASHVDVKNVWSSISTPLYAFMACRQTNLSLPYLLTKRSPSWFKLVYGQWRTISSWRTTLEFPCTNVACADLICKEPV